MKLALLLLALTSPPVRGEVRTMSTYSDHFEGKPMANGKIYQHSLKIVATYAYPLGTRLRLTLKDRSIEVLVSDRPHRKYGHRLDASRSVWSYLTNKAPLGLRKVHAEKIGGRR